MILSGSAIREYVDAGLITIKPHFDKKQLRPFGLRVHLADKVLRPRIDLRVDLSRAGKPAKLFDHQSIRRKPLILKPGDFVLGSCVELIRLDNHIVGVLDGRNTLARLGIVIHCSSNTLDGNSIEFRSIVIEIKNIGPFEVTIPFGYPIGMILFQVSNVPSNKDLIQAQYVGQQGVRGPNLGFNPPPLTKSKRTWNTKAR